VVSRSGRIVSVVAACGVLALGVAACGDDAEDSNGSGSTAPEIDPRLFEEPAPAPAE
jgi:hypothetical protein